MIRKGRWKVLFYQLGKPTRTRLCVLLSSPQILGIVWIYSHLIRARAGTETVPVARVSRFQDMLWAVSSFNAQFRKADSRKGLVQLYLNKQRKQTLRNEEFIIFSRGGFSLGRCLGRMGHVLQRTNTQAKEPSAKEPSRGSQETRTGRSE